MLTLDVSLHVRMGLSIIPSQSSSIPLSGKSYAPGLTFVGSVYEIKRRMNIHSIISI
jgi:hypothetical protein